MDQIHGVTFDGAHVWFARGESIVAFDPESGALAREQATSAGSTLTAARCSIGSSCPTGSA
jgi:hypothetical protein